MPSNVGLLMISEGLLSREDLERALARKRNQGGSLALNLVLEGSLDELSLAVFYAERFELDHTTDAMLQGVTVATFALIPIEIIYDSAIMPLYLKNEDTLVVGLVDPTDSELLTEAGFFSGFNLEARIITVSQMALHFSRLAGQAWKVSAETARSLSRRDEAVDLELDLDSQIESLFDQTAVFDMKIESSLEASLDVTYSAPPPVNEMNDILPDMTGDSSIWMAVNPEPVETIRIQSGIEDLEVVVDADDFQEVTTSTMQMAALRFDKSPAQKVVTRVTVPEQLLEDLGFDESTDTIETPVVVEGDITTATGAMRVLGFALDRGMPATVTDSGPRPVIEERLNPFKDRPKSYVPSVPAAAMAAEVNPWDFHPLSQFGRVFGETDARVAAQINYLTQYIYSAVERDQIAQAVVDGLAPIFEHVAVMTLSGPRAVIWRANRRGRELKELAGVTIDLHVGGVLHKISQDQDFFFGPLPVSSPLLRAFNVRPANKVLVAPIMLRAKTILILLLEHRGDAFPSPGHDLAKLLVDMSKGLERVILMRKRGRRQH